MRRLIPAIVIAILLATPIISSAQSLSDSDMQLICASERSAGDLGERHVRYGFKAGKKTINPIYHLLSASMYFYQRCVSPVISRSCAFSPTCSGYSKALIKEYGLLKGSICTADRLMRCNRISLADPSNYSQIDPKDGHIHESVKRYSKR